MEIFKVVKGMEVIEAIEVNMKAPKFQGLLKFAPVSISRFYAPYEIVVVDKMIFSSRKMLSFVT